MALKQIRWFLLVGMSLQVAITHGQSLANNNQDFLSNYKWQKRLILIFSPKKDNPDGTEQLKLLNQAKQGLADRDLVLIPVVENNIESKKTGNITAADLRHQFQIESNAFTLILIGKDGGEKYRTDRVTKPTTIFNIIDAMPMRQSEMQQKSN